MWAVGASVPSRRVLIAATLATAGLFARPASGPRGTPQPAITCAIPDVTMKPPASPGRSVVTATLVWRPDSFARCGMFFGDTVVVFVDVHGDGAMLRVRVPCLEMPRRMYSRSAGNAGVLEVGRTYRLELTGPTVDHFELTGPIDDAGKYEHTWRAERIDVVPTT